MPKINVARELKSIRKRTELGIGAFAVKLGYAGASSYQRYEDEGKMAGKLLPFPLAYKIIVNFEGKGSPPIKREEVLAITDATLVRSLLQEPKRNQGIEPNRATVVGIVAAGVWRQGEVTMDESKLPPVPTVPGDMYRSLPQIAYLVEGNSINKHIQHGEFAICVRFPEIMREPRHGDLVVVERTRDGGLHEYSVKRVRTAADGSMALWPESTDPQHQEPLRLAERPTDNIQVTVVGLVIGKFAHL